MLSNIIILAGFFFVVALFAERLAHEREELHDLRMEKLALCQVYLHNCL